MQAVIYTKSPLTDFQRCVNEAAVKLALMQPDLLRNRGAHLDQVRKMVAEEGYNFKKGSSRSKVYRDVVKEMGDLKSPKVNKNIRDERMKEVEEDIKDISSQVVFKEKCLKPAEGSKDFKTCDRLTKEVIECKSRRRELEKELKLLQQKSKKALKRAEMIQNKFVRSSTPYPPMPPHSLQVLQFQFYHRLIEKKVVLQLQLYRRQGVVL